MSNQIEGKEKKKPKVFFLPSGSFYTPTLAHDLTKDFATAPKAELEIFL
jgi:hypothetical protein